MFHELYNGFNQLPNTVIVLVVAHGEKANHVSYLPPHQPGTITSELAYGRPLVEFNGSLLHKYTAVPRGQLAIFGDSDIFEKQKNAFNDCIDEFNSRTLSLTDNGAPLESFYHFMCHRGKYIYINSLYDSFGWILPTYLGVEKDQRRKRDARRLLDVFEQNKWDWLIPCLLCVEPNISEKDRVQNLQIVERMNILELNGVYLDRRPVSTVQDKKFLYTGKRVVIDDIGRTRTLDFYKEMEDELNENYLENIDSDQYETETETETEEQVFQRVIDEYQQHYYIEV
jgi:hypothetical protein